MDNFLFLDADGVFNTIENKLLSKDNRQLNIDGCVFPTIYYKPQLVRNINALCDRYNLKVVFSSTWRQDYELPYMKQLFKYIGFTCQLVDYTTTENLPHDIENNDLRGLQIQQWLEKNIYADYIVIDDMFGAGGYQHADRFIHVDNMSGFDYTAYKLAINKFDNIFGVQNGIKSVIQ